MRYFKINNQNTKQLFLNLGSETMGANIMSSKTYTNLLYIKDIKTSAANILKQDALSIGAELATPRGTISNQYETVDAILIGSNKHFDILSKKLLLQPFGLKMLANDIKSFKTKPNKPTKIMGVLNINEDSFYEKSRAKSGDILQKIENMITDGANIIDIGAVSSRPGSSIVDEDEEFSRIKPTIDLIYKDKIYDKTILSIDSCNLKTVSYALEHGFKIVNDITALSNEKIATLTSKYDATLVLMHMQNNPQTMQQNPKYDDVVLDIDSFFQDRLEIVYKHNIKDVVLDVGIGFGKTKQHNISLLQNIEHFRRFGHELLIGVSRKSIINDIYPSSVQDRLSGTIAIHLNSIKNGVSYIRCHDVKEHCQAIKIQGEIYG
ncbi:MAG: dihydropteroate synthase [Campylobacteraceae bacterium 4484_166]|nr:MAG: dihydropteroate synthase [Campylobacteraceae bacterium 4484_166]